MTETDVECPFCGEQFSILVDCSQEDQTYIEDCSVCCRPINFHIICNEGELISIQAERDN